MTIDHAGAETLLERFGAAWQGFDGDAWTDLFTDDAEFREDPFEPPRPRTCPHRRRRARDNDRLVAVEQGGDVGNARLGLEADIDVGAGGQQFHAVAAGEEDAADKDE